MKQVVATALVLLLTLFLLPLLLLGEEPLPGRPSPRRHRHPAHRPHRGHPRPDGPDGRVRGAGGWGTGRC